MYFYVSFSYKLIVNVFQFISKKIFIIFIFHPMFFFINKHVFNSFSLQ